MINSSDKLQDIAPVRLPIELSRIINDHISSFVKEHAEEGVQAHQRWHGADLWMIYADSLDEDTNTIVTRRVTIGAFSDEPDRLVFISDIITTRQEERYTLPFDERRKYITAPISVRLKLDEVVGYGKLNGDVEASLAEGWKTASSISPKDATVKLQ